MRIAIALLALLLAFPSRADDAVDKLIECMGANVPDALRIQEVELTTIDRDGGRTTLRGRMYAMRETVDGERLVRTMFRIQGPEHLAGASWLIRQSDDYLRDGMYVYLPSVRRVRQVTGSMADGSLFGTRFSYADFRYLASSFGGARITAEPPAKIGNRAVQVLSFRPTVAAPSAYTQVRLSVDEKTCVPLQAEYMGGNQVRRRLTVPASALVQAGDRWYAKEVHLEDLTRGGKSILKVARVSSGKDIGGQYFNPQLFHTTP